MRFKLLYLVCFIFIVSCSLEFENGKGNKFALIYGINIYQNVGPNLNYCVADAIGISNIIKDYGYNIILRTDSNATKSAISNDILSIVPSLNPEDTLIFYFSGHGYRDGFLSYIVPFDANNNTNSFISEVELFEWLKDSKTEKILLIFDHCFSGAYIAYRRFFVMTASAANEYSIEDDYLQHGLFTYYFIKGISNRVADINRDGIISASELFTYIENIVPDYKFPVPYPPFLTNQHPQFLGKTNVELVLF